MKRTVDPLLLIGSILVLAAVLTWVLPAGRYQRAQNPSSGQTMVVPGSYRTVASNPCGPWKLLQAIPAGLLNAAPVVFYVLIAGGSLTVIELTGAFAAALAFLVGRFGSRPALLLPLIALLFIAGGSTFGMYEEILAFLPVLCLLMSRLGMDSVTALALSVGASSVASAFSPVNTFQLGISQPLAELPLFSGFGVRAVFFVLAVIVWMAFTIRHALRVRASASRAESTTIETATDRTLSPRRCAAVLAVLNLGMAALVTGAISLKWEMEQFSAVFVVMGVLGGLAGGLGLRGTSEGFAEGFRRLALAAILIGLARGISVILDQGLILDTIAHALFDPLSRVPKAAAGVIMLIGQSLICLPLPSDSGRAMTTLPILIPLADLLAISRQAVITAYQSAVVISALVAPTCGTLLAMLAIAKVPLGQWLRFVALPVVVISALGAAAVAASMTW